MLSFNKFGNDCCVPIWYDIASEASVQRPIKSCRGSWKAKNCSTEQIQTKGLTSATLVPTLAGTKRNCYFAALILQCETRITNCKGLKFWKVESDYKGKVWRSSNRSNYEQVSSFTDVNDLSQESKRSKRLHCLLASSQRIQNHHTCLHRTPRMKLSSLSNCLPLLKEKHVGIANCDDASSLRIASCGFCEVSTSDCLFLKKLYSWKFKGTPPAMFPQEISSY